MPKPTEHGEIWWADLDKRRPVVVVSRDDPRGRRHQTTVAAITTTIRGILSEIPLDHRDGFAEACAINCDVLTTIAKSSLVRRVGRLSEGKLGDLHDALAFSLQIPGPSSV